MFNLISHIKLACICIVFQMWCSNPSTAYLVKMKNDVHAMSKWRVNGVLSNMDEFSKAFNCPRGSPMNPEEKCTLW